MADGIEKWSFTAHLVHSLGFGEALGSHHEHRERIQNKLRAFLSAREARETAARVHNLALDIDQEIDRILKDPRVRRLYEYDGQFFTSRGARLFHRAFDGLHLMESLSNSSLEAFFRGREKHSAIRWMLKELGTHAWVDSIRRMNWEEFNTLGLVPPEVISTIIENARVRRREAEAETSQMSLEERAFFRSFEEQMQRQG